MTRSEIAHKRETHFCLPFGEALRDVMRRVACSLLHAHAACGARASPASVLLPQQGWHRQLSLLSRLKTVVGARPGGRLTRARRRRIMPVPEREGADTLLRCFTSTRHSAQDGRAATCCW